MKPCVRALDPSIQQTVTLKPYLRLTAFAMEFWTDESQAIRLDQIS